MKSGCSAVALVLAVLALAGIGCKRVVEDTVAAQNPYPADSPLHAPTDRVLRRMANDPRYLRIIGESATNPAQAQNRVVELTVDGLPRLDDNALAQHMELVGEILDASSDTDCAQIAQSARNDPDAMGNALTNGLRQLPEDRINAWFDLSLQASNAALDNAPVPAMDAAATDRVLARLIAGLPQQSQAAALTALTEPGQASSGDLCNVSRLVYHEARKLPAAERAALARALVTGI